jgi:hypothetical protein
MAYKQTLGEAFSKPYESVTRAGGNISRSRMNDARTNQMPEQLDLRRQSVDNRIQLIQHQMRMAEQRMGLMGQRQNLMASGQNEKIREFDINDAFRNKALGMGVGPGGKQPAYLKAFNDAQNAAEEGGALNQDGSVDMDKLGQNPQLMARYNLGIEYANKLSNTAQTLNRGNYAEIMDQTMSALNIDKLRPAFEHYSGAFGPEKYNYDAIQAANGKEMPQYFHDYQTYLATKPLLGEQIRNFLGGSITPESMKKVDSFIAQDDRRISAKQRESNLNTIFTLLQAEGAKLRTHNQNPQNVPATQQNTAAMNKINNLPLGPGAASSGLRGGKTGRNYTQEEITQLAEQNGIDVEQLKEILGRTG